MRWNYDFVETTCIIGMAVMVILLGYVICLIILDETKPTETVYLCPECGWEGTEDDMDSYVIMTGYPPVPITYYECPDCGENLDDSWYSKEVPK